MTDRNIEELLSTVAHDLKNPLSSMMGFASLLSRPQVTDERRIQYARNISRAGELLLAMINNMVDAQALQSGPLEIDPADFDLGDLLREVGQMYELLGQRRGIVLKVDCASPTVVCADRRRIWQALINLLDNALRSTATGGSITLSARPIGDRVHVDVTDTGSGIPATVQARLFTPYLSLEEGRPRAGLGLYVTRHLLAAHGSEVAVESEVGKGTRVSFSLAASSI